MIDARLINQPSIDFATFLGIANEALGYSPAGKSDASARKLSDAEKFLSCLEALHNPKAAPGLYPHLLNHVSFSVLIAADERDLLDILSAASGMSFVTTETRARGIQLCVVSGSLAQWRSAVIGGTQVRGECQALYCKILTLFEQAGLNVWKDCTKRAEGKLFLLEDHRTK